MSEATAAADNPPSQPSSSSCDNTDVDAAGDARMEGEVCAAPQMSESSNENEKPRRPSALDTEEDDEEDEMSSNNNIINAPLTTPSAPLMSAATDSPSNHHVGTLRSAAASLLHSVKGAGRSITNLASALAHSSRAASRPVSGDEGSTSSNESSSEDDAETDDESTLDMAEGSSQEEEEDEDNLYVTPRSRSSSKTLAGVGAPHSTDEQISLFAKRLAMRKRVPSYAHLFPDSLQNEPATPIESHGLIGNCNTTATINTNGSLVWYCFPYHDSPPIFHSLLDPSGGCFKITAGREANGSSSHMTTKQLYFSETNVLLTRFFTDSGVGHVTDYFPMGDVTSRYNAKRWIVREIEVVRGKLYWEVECTPTFNFGRTKHQVRMLPCGALFETKEFNMLLTSSKSRVWKRTKNNGIKTKVTLEEGQRVVFVLREWNEHEEKKRWEEERKARELIERQKAYFEQQLQKLQISPTAATGPAQLSSHATTSFRASDNFIPTLGLPPACSAHQCASTPKEHHTSTTADTTGNSDANTFGVHQIKPISIKVTDKLKRHTLEYWRDWVGLCQYEGRWRETMRRSALLLKLLTFQPTGAIIQAPTCALPTVVGIAGPDARHVNIRDACLTASAFLRLGFRNEASAFMAWLGDRCSETQYEKDGVHLQINYSIHGAKELPSMTYTDVQGYKGSGPVMTGLGAKRFCLDIYGTLLVLIYLSNLYAEPISYSFWEFTCKIVDFVCDHWQEPDDGIWVSDAPVSEQPPPRRHYTYSKLMCWVCVDRGLKLAKERSLPAPLEKWHRVRDEICMEVHERGWNKEMKTFTQVYDGTHLDASLLLMPVTSFLPASDPRFLSTLDQITRSVDCDGLMSNNLIRRSNAPDEKGAISEVTVSLCTFWAIEACTRAGLADARYLNRARLLMEQMLGYANHIGFFSECIGLRGGFLGNTPHCLTHVSLIRAAMFLDLALHKQKPHHVVQAMIADLPNDHIQVEKLGLKS